MRGRPVVGVICGFLFGLFVAVLLQQLSIRPLDTVSLIGFPVAGIVLGLLLAATAPFGRSSG